MVATTRFFSILWFPFQFWVDISRRAFQFSIVKVIGKSASSVIYTHYSPKAKKNRLSVVNDANMTENFDKGTLAPSPAHTSNSTGLSSEYAKTILEDRLGTILTLEPQIPLTIFGSKSQHLYPTYGYNPATNQDQLP